MAKKPMKKPKSAKPADGANPDTKKGKKGKKKKGKVSLADKKREKLEKACEEFTLNKAFYENFTGRMDRWLLENGQVLVNMFMKFDQDSSGQISYDEFCSGLFDLSVPCNSIEQYFLCRLLDPKNTERIDYLDLSLGLLAMREKLLAKEDVEEEFESEVEEEPDDIEPIGEPIRVFRPPSAPLKRYEYPDHCLCCKMALCGPYQEKEPKYVELWVRLASFESMKNHPGHFDQVVHTHVPVIGLIQMIREVTNLNSTRIGVFLDNISATPDMLDLSKSLDDYNIEGGSRQHPPKVLLFYDYSVEFVGCPLLSCDHYFIKSI